MTRAEPTGPHEPFYNVRDFGAVGDGIANDTLAIQATIDTAGGAGYRAIVLFPPGAYRITSAITLGSGAIVGISKPIVLQGVGQATQIIHDGPPNTFAFNFAGVSFWTLRDMLITASSQGTVAARTAQIREGVLVAKSPEGNQCARFLIERVTTQVPGRGFVLQNTNSGVLRECRHWPSSNSAALTLAQRIEDARVIHHAFHMTGIGPSGFCNDITFYDCDAQMANGYRTGAASYKFDAANGSSIRVFGGLVEGVGQQDLDKHSFDYSSASGALDGFQISGVYAQNTNMSFAGVYDGLLIGMDRNGTGVLRFDGCTRVTNIGSVERDVVVDARCTNIHFIDTEIAGAFTDDTRGAGVRFTGVTHGNRPLADRGRTTIAFRVLIAGSVAIDAGTIAQITHKTSDFDDFGVHSTTSGRFTPGVIGKYRISVTGSWSLVTPGAAMITKIHKNGEFYEECSHTAPLGGRCGLGISCLVNVKSALDYFEVYAHNMDVASRVLTESVFSAEAV